MDTIAHYWDDNPFVTEHRGHLMFAAKNHSRRGTGWGSLQFYAGRQSRVNCKKQKYMRWHPVAILMHLFPAGMKKYRSKMVRPITVIRENIEPEWNSFLQTPPFPEYTSGHSVITAAASTVLTHMIGDNTALLIPLKWSISAWKRHFSSIIQAADEAGIRAVWWHPIFRSAIEEKKQGHHIGELYNLVF